MGCARDLLGIFDEIAHIVADGGEAEHSSKRKGEACVAFAADANVEEYRCDHQHMEKVDCSHTIRKVAVRMVSANESAHHGDGGERFVRKPFPCFA